jgi:hypothetical protein
VEDDGLYSLLAEPFPGYYTAQGVFGPFLSGEQVTSRLNEVLGVGLWQFAVVSATVDPTADEVVVLGELRASIHGQWVTRQQFGGQKIKRARDTGTPTNLADDHKGAATDALKKCASMLGVGLYLMVSSATWHAGVPPRNEPQGPPGSRGARPAASRPAQAPVRSLPEPGAPAAAGDAPAQDRADGAGARPVKCMNCDQPLTEVTVPARNGKPAEKWTVAKLRYQGLRRHAMVLCATCFRTASAQAAQTG